MNEFSLIDYYFKTLATQRRDVVFGIGDDAACLQVPPGHDLLVSTDTFVSGVHFLPEWDAYDIACKAVMSTVSDMAAMAASPSWLTLALTMPELNESWLSAFSKGLGDSQGQYGIDLVGGDTTRGPLAITLTIMGFAPVGLAVKRNAAKPGDVIWVSGELGAAALAVHFLNNNEPSQADKAQMMHKLLHPKPRLDLTMILRQFATAAIDISDGLSADLNHICTASGVGACINESQLPIHPLLSKYLPTKTVDLALTGGDDYELCFTVPASQSEALMDALQKAGLVCYPIGVMQALPGLRIQKTDGRIEALVPQGYQHFCS